MSSLADPKITSLALSAWAKVANQLPAQLIPALPAKPVKRTKLNLKKIERMAKRGRRKAVAKPVRRSNWIPPCIQRIKERAERGDNLSHEERLILLFWWMNNVTQDVDELVSLFRNVPDFNEKKTKYYVEHALKKGYRPFGCEKIKALGLCPVEGKCIKNQISSSSSSQ